MNRREFITLLGGAAAGWPVAARAQQPMPAVGFLDAQALSSRNPDRMRAFQQGLRETGYVDGDNVIILNRSAENQIDRLPELAADLVRRQVAVLATYGNAPAIAAKAATATVPIVFAVSEDPIRYGLVASLARPGGNATGVNFLAAEVTTKRLELLRMLVPRAVKLAVLVDPGIPPTATTLRELEAAAQAMGLRMEVFTATTASEINMAFAALAREQSDALFVGGGFLFNSRRVQLAHLATHYRLPASYQGREHVEAGGLMSYSPNDKDAFRQIGAYTGRILKGAKPADLPVVQATKFELVINAETAGLLGLDVPPSLIAIADEVIE
jgi:putative ABC transport system substrate-binding protein